MQHSPNLREIGKVILTTPINTLFQKWLPQNNLLNTLLLKDKIISSEGFSRIIEKDFPM